MTLEQLREQCAKTCEKKLAYVNNNKDAAAMALSCGRSIRALPLPNTPDYEKQIAELKESLRYVIEQCEEWQNFATGCEQEENEEMKLAKERAK